MALLVRLFEKMTGRTHRHSHSAEVAEEARKLSTNVRDLSERLRPYVEADDPLVALMTDMFNQRALQGERATSQTGSRK